MRESGVGWLGDVPADWDVVPSRALFGERKTRSSASDIHLTPSQKYGVLPQAEYMEITGNKVVLNLSGSDNMRHVEPGDYISHLRSFQGGLEHAMLKGKVSAAYTVLKPKMPVDGRYFKYLFKSDLYVQALQTTTDQLRDGQSIRFGEFSLIPLPHPALVEQRVIADFLDRETAQIDAFIAKNEELIALLTERRATVIRNATTTGIGYHDDLVDSGDEQVGSIPTRWRMLRLSFLFGSTASGTTPASEQILDADHADVPWVTTGELREAQITGTLRGVSAEILATTPALRLHPEGALLIAMYGATIGRTAILRVPAASNQAVCALSRPTGCDVEYVELALQASRERLRLKAVGGGQPNINQETVRAFRIPVPPLEEQRAIVAYVKEQTAHINAAMANAMRCADLARERRAALISAAVTGKIDVGVSA